VSSFTEIPVPHLVTDHSFAANLLFWEDSINLGQGGSKNRLDFGVYLQFSLVKYFINSDCKVACVCAFVKCVKCHISLFIRVFAMPSLYKRVRFECKASHFLCHSIAFTDCTDIIE